ncbi:MAG: dihydrofolate reductase [Bacteroidota bacterium]|nr:dihydrofolate reductase [Bacteroidota bacterium]MDP4206576.1 dihydrofolate reductase [Bacteroidota bacterium]
MIYKNISIIVAIARNAAIGKDNNLLFHLSNDLKRFKQITSGHPIIMGRKTLLSLPKWPLPNRTNIVITHHAEIPFPGCIVVPSVEEAIKAVDNEAEAFVIGGESIYRQFYSFANKLYLTLVDQDFEADTFFPEIIFEEWTEVFREEHFDEKNGFKYTFLNLVRK